MSILVTHLVMLLEQCDPDATVRVSMVYDRYPNIPGSQRPLESECTCIVLDQEAGTVTVHGAPADGR